MKIGDIFNFTNNRIRVLMFDDNEVFYQTIDEDDIFVYTKYKTISYYWSPRDFFNKNSEFIMSMELSNKELEIHRPDLPLRLNCFSGLFWTDKSFENDYDFNNFINSTGINKERLIGLNNSKVVIVPTSQQQASKKPILLQNEKGYFSGEELMNQCFRIQSEYVNYEKSYFSRFRLIPDGREEKRLSGIGIYRLGIKGNLPSYYLGGEISMGELESDKNFIVEK